MNSLVLVTENFSEGSRQEFSNAREFEDRVGRNLWTRLRDQIQQVKTVTFGQVIILQQFIPKSWYWIKSEVLSSWAMFVLLVSEQYFNCKMVFMLQNTATTGSPTNQHTIIFFIFVIDQNSLRNWFCTFNFSTSKCPKGGVWAQSKHLHFLCPYQLRGRGVIAVSLRQLNWWHVADFT